MTINELYQKNRHLINDGDLILFNGTGIVANVIKYCDNAEFSHIGVVFKAHDALYIEDANSNGVQADRLSFRINSYKENASFIILRPLISNDKIKIALHNLLNRPDNKSIKYDYINGISELLNRKFKLNLNIKHNDDRDICSDFISTYAKELILCTDEFNSLLLVLPQDYLRYNNSFNVSILQLIDK
jgi:hypothetical protein